MTPDSPPPEPAQATAAGEARMPSFTALYSGQAREVIRELAREAVVGGADPAGQARDYAERGKPDFTLAYLLAGDALPDALPDAEKRALYAQAFERRATLTEGKAREFDQKFRRPFPLLLSDAAQDRAQASRIRAGKRLGAGGAGKRLPLL